MSIISRPPKQGGSTTYQGKVAQGFKTILASEADADLNTIYDAWNDGVDAVNIRPNAITADKIAPNQVGPRELVDNLTGADVLAVDAITARELAPDAVGTVELQNGSVTNAKLAADANLWTDTGTALRPTTATRSLALGSGTVKGTLESSATGATFLATNNHAAPMDLAQSSWGLSLNPTADALNVFRRAPGAAAGAITNPFLIRSDGKTVCSLADASVQKDMLAPGAAVRSNGSFPFPPSLNITAGFWVSPGTVTLTTKGGPVLVMIVAGLATFTSANGTFYVGYSRGASLAGAPVAWKYTAYPMGPSSVPVPTFCYVDTPPAGVQNYYANFQVTIGALVSGPSDPGFIAAVEFS